MSQFKTELHCHTSEVSPCAYASAEQVVDAYLAAGYTTLVITDHLVDSILDFAGEAWRQKIDHFLSGYRHARDCADGRLNVLLGCELRFTGDPNDYLVFGMDEDFLYTHPELYKSSLARFRPFAIEHGMLIVQAHPFRNGMKITNPRYLDGIEVFNSTPIAIHNSRNDFANRWAMANGLIRTAGSDYHGGKYPINGGILTDEPVTSMEQLVDILRHEQHTLLCQGPDAEAIGFSSMPAKY